VCFLVCEARKEHHFYYFEKMAMSLAINATEVPFVLFFNSPISNQQGLPTESLSLLSQCNQSIVLFHGRLEKRIWFLAAYLAAGLLT